MITKLRIIFVLAVMFTAINGVSQELRCNIQVTSDKVQGTNKKVFETLQTSLNELINNRNWTNHVYTAEERIECNMLFNIQDYSGSDFKGTLQIQARRPVYNSSYNTVLLNYMDNNIQFTYVEFETLEFNESTFTSNLTALIAYYAYVIIGLDYDTYSNKGGSEYFRKAESIVNNAQNAPEKGWKAFEGSNKNRYWLIQNLMDEKYSPVRDFLYKYHRLGLDRMSEKPNEGRDEIAEDLKLLQQVYRNKPDPYMHLLQVIFDAKSDEMINVFSESVPEERNRVLPILKEIDPANSTKYQKINK